MADNDEGSKMKKNARENKKAFSGLSDGSDDEDGIEQRAISRTRIHDLEQETNYGLLAKRASSNNSNTVNNEDTSEGSDNKQYHTTSQASPEWKPVPANSKINYAEKPKAEHSLQLNLDKWPISMRTRRVNRQ